MYILIFPDLINIFTNSDADVGDPGGMRLLVRSTIVQMLMILVVMVSIMIQRPSNFQGVKLSLPIFVWFIYCNHLNLHPRKLTWIPKIAMFERRYIWKTTIFGIYVRFQGGIHSAFIDHPFSPSETMACAGDNAHSEYCDLFSAPRRNGESFGWTQGVDICQTATSPPT